VFATVANDVAYLQRFLNLLQLMLHNHFLLFCSIGMLQIDAKNTV
jgi:hypothetical protein